MTISKGSGYFLLLIANSCFSQDKTPSTITIVNRLSQPQFDKIVSISWSELTNRFGQIDTAACAILELGTKREIPIQFETKGTKQVQNLLVQVSLKAKSTLRLIMIRRRHQTFAAKTFGRHVPERKDDFAWENDKIAFRMYGKALEGTSENASGIDIWVKRTNELIINKRYQRGNYHFDHGDGLDYYHVGLTLGAGNMMPFINDSIWYSGNYRQWNVLDNGPLRTSFELTYDEWGANGKPISVKKKVTLDAGTHFNRIEVGYKFEDTGYIPVVIGITKRPNSGIAYLNEQERLMTYWEPTDRKFGTTGVAVIAPETAATMRVNQQHLLLIGQAKSSLPVVYYMGACWDRAGIFQDDKKWLEYVERSAREVQTPLQVSF